MKRKPAKYWDDWKHVSVDMKAEIDKEYRDDDGNVVKKSGEFPTQKQLSFVGSSGIVGGIRRKHGGMSSVREKMGIKLDNKPRGYWMDWKNVEKELKGEIDKEYRDDDGNVVKKSGEFPTKDQLQDFDRTDLAGAIRKKKYGGFITVKKKMGFEHFRKPGGYWDDWKNVEKELKGEIDKEYRDDDGNIVKKSGEFPTQDQLANAGRKDLCVIYKKNKHGGIKVVRQRMGYSNEKINSHEAFYVMITSEDDAKLIVQSFGGDDADVADIMAVVYGGRITRDDVMQFIQEPSLRDYLGGFQKPDSISDFIEAGERLLPYDKNGIIGEIIYRRALEYRSKQLGPNPTAKQRAKFLRELDSQITAFG